MRALIAFWTLIGGSTLQYTFFIRLKHSAVTTSELCQYWSWFSRKKSFPVADGFKCLAMQDHQGITMLSLLMSLGMTSWMTSRRLQKFFQMWLECASSTNKWCEGWCNNDCALSTFARQKDNISNFAFARKKDKTKKKEEKKRELHMLSASFAHSVL